MADDEYDSILEEITAKARRQAQDEVARLERLIRDLEGDTSRDTVPSLFGFDKMANDLKEKRRRLQDG